MANKTAELEDVRDLISNKIEELERNLNWLHRKTGIPYGTLYSMFVQKLFQVSKENLKLINKALGTDFKQ